MAMTGERYEISAGDYRAAVCQVGAALASLSWQNEAVTVPHLPDTLPPGSNGAVLMPWPNRIRGGAYRFDGRDQQLPLSEAIKGNASHGLVRWVRWEVADLRPDSVTLVHDLVPQTGYPFELRFELRYLLEAGSGLAVHARAINVGSRRAPFGAGFHPYLDLGDHDVDHAKLLLPADTVLVVDDGLIPVGRRPVATTPYDIRQLRALGTLRLDHGFTDLVSDRAVVDTGDRRTEIWWEPTFGTIQVFTPEPARIGANAIAIEPMTCPANAFNSGESLLVLAPDQEWTGNWGIDVIS